MATSKALIFVLEVIAVLPYWTTVPLEQISFIDHYVCWFQMNNRKIACPLVTMETQILLNDAKLCFWALSEKMWFLNMLIST